MLRTLNILSFLLITGNPLFAQVEIDKSIIFDSQHDGLRNIYNVGLPTDTKSGISIKTGYENSVTLLKSTSVSSNLYNLSTSIPNFNLTKGTLIQFKIPENNTGPVSINIDGTGNYNLVKHGNIALSERDLIKDQMVDIIYDGTKFQILNIGYTPSCKTGFVSVNDSYCIEINSHSPLNWFDAVRYCMDNGARLCSWGEFNLACELLTDASNDFTLNWEWTNSTGDHHRMNRSVGLNGCQNGDSFNAEIDILNFRCCLDK